MLYSGKKPVKYIFSGNVEVKRVYDGNNKVWEEETPPQTSPYLTFTAEEAGSTVKIEAVGSAPVILLKTSTDYGENWTTYSVGQTITLANVGDHVSFVADGHNDRMGSEQSNYNKFVMTGKIAASGNVNSLLEEDVETAATMSLNKTYCCYGMFNGCSSLTQAPELPATTLASNCYAYMFQNCSSLTQAPELPATTLAGGCYNSMFKDCSSLETAPSVLPATTLADYCYASMFIRCTSLTQVPSVLPATTLAQNCYKWMFQNCSSLETAPALPATTLANECYKNMFYSCSKLKQAPVLPATTFADSCYKDMFLYSLYIVKDIYIPNLTEEEYNAEKARANSGDFGRESAVTFHFKAA